MIKGYKKYVYGIFVTTVIAIISISLGKLVPVIGGSIFALMIGMISRSVFNQQRLESGLQFVSKKILKLAIILLGTSLSIVQLLTVGKYSLFVMVFTLTAAFLSSWLFGRLLKTNWKLSNLIGAGTGICGGSAIATISPIIEADDTDVAYAMSATFIFDILMIVIFPIMGVALGLSDLAYGLWTGTAVNDTSSVVAAGYAFSDTAGNFATIVKLTRTTSIVPITLIFAFIRYKDSKSTKNSINVFSIKKIFPWFILFFVLASIINTIGLIPADIKINLNLVSKFFMAMALGAIGLKTNLHKLIQTGIRPLILGFIVSLVVVVVSIYVQYLMGQV